MNMQQIKSKKRMNLDYRISFEKAKYQNHIIIIMPYSIKVRIDKDRTIEVAGDQIELVVRLLNEVTRKFFSSFLADKVII